MGPADPTGSILIVDDDRVSRVLLRHMLEAQGREVVEADSVDEALRILSESGEAVSNSAVSNSCFQLVICDYVMTDRNGLDLLEALPQRLPFVLLTGELRECDLDDVRVAGVAAYLTKPVSSSELEHVVESLTAASA